MSNLLKDISGRRDENLTTKFLVNLFEREPHLYLKKLLELLSSETDYKDVIVIPQSSNERGRPDIELKTKYEGDKGELIFIENKPWFDSHFTSQRNPQKPEDFENQIKRYADKLKEETKYNTKRLCLLARGKTEIDQFMNVIARVEQIKTNQVSIDTIVEYYENKGIHFSVLKWGDVLRSLQTLDSNRRCLVDEIYGYIFPNGEETPLQNDEDITKHLTRYKDLASDANDVLLNWNKNNHNKFDIKSDNVGSLALELEYVDKKISSNFREFYWRSNFFGCFGWGASSNLLNPWKELTGESLNHPFFLYILVPKAETVFIRRIKHGWLYEFLYDENNQLKDKDNLLINRLGFKYSGENTKLRNWDWLAFFKPLNVDESLAELEQNQVLLAEAAQEVIDQLTNVVKERIQVEFKAKAGQS